MSGVKFQYDSVGNQFYYFLLSFECFILVPCTLLFIYGGKDTNCKNNNKNAKCMCENCLLKQARLRAKEPWRKAKERFMIFLLCIGWFILVLTVLKILNLEQDFVAFDPYSILDISPDASVAEIKKAYRRLSLLFHPDKTAGDETKFLLIAKAYTALTDEAAKKNLELYGDPYGPGATSFGIALPSFIVEKENAVLVLAVYGLIFMVALPIGVCCWWYRALKFSDKVFYATTELYYALLDETPSMIFKRVLMVIAASCEFNKAFNSEVVERASDEIEVPLLIKELSHLSLGQNNRQRPLCFSYSIKARVLLYAHLNRTKLPSRDLEHDQLFVVAKVPTLLQEFICCCSLMISLAGKISRIPSLETVENAMKLCACVVQAQWPVKSPLLQLPHVSEDMLKYFVNKKRNVRTVLHLAQMKDEERRSMLRGLTDQQYQDIINVISKMPNVEVQVKYEVLDDEDSHTITAGSTVTITATIIRTDLSTILQSEGDPVDIGNEEAEGPNAGTELSPSKGKRKVWEKPKKKKSKKAHSTNPKKKLGKREKLIVSNGTVVQKSIAKESDETKKGEESNSDSGEDNECENSKNDENDELNKTYARDKKDDDDWEKIKKKLGPKKENFDQKSKSHVVHCPYFPEEKYECWWIYLLDRWRRVVVTPFLVTGLVDKEEVELRVVAPAKPGNYAYSVVVRSDSYLGLDVTKQIDLDVKEAKEINLNQVQWDDVSDNEEDKDDEEESAVEDSDLASDLESESD